MTRRNDERPKPQEIAKQVEQLVNETPPEVVERMTQRLEQRRQSPTMSVPTSELMTKRVGSHPGNTESRTG